MALNPNDFEVIDDKPAQADPSQFEVIGSPTPDNPKFNIVETPYDKYRLAIAKGATPENYSELPEFAGQPFSPRNPDYDLVRATRGETILAPLLATGAKVLGAAEKHMPVPVRYALTGKDLSKYSDTSEAEQFPFTPYVDMPQVSPEDMKNLPPALQRVASGANAINKTIEGFSVPVNAAKLPVGEGMAIPFALQLASEIPSQIKEVKDAPDANARTAAATRLGTSLAMGGLLARGHLGREAAPEVQGPPTMGSMLKMPAGATPELRVEDFEPLDTQSGAPLSPQELIARQSRVTTPPEAPAPEVKTFNLDEEVPNATETRQQPEGNQPEHPGDGGERPPAQASGSSGTPPGTPTQETPSTQPVPQASDARGTPDTAPRLKDDLDKVAGMTDKEFSDFHNANVHRGGMTGVAHEIGQNVQSIEEVNDLKSKQDAEAEKFQEAKKKKDFPAMSAAANKGQFFREAYEAATGTGSAGKSLSESDPTYSPPFPGGKVPEMVGMGGAVPSEFEPGAGEGRDVYGISHEVREARAKAGVVDPVERGKGISAPDSIDRGQSLLNGGVDPEAALSNFEKTGRLSADDIAVTRARGEELARNARAAERQFGTESPEYKAAYDKISDWDRRTKKMQTEWHKQGQAQQGATDIDTGSFTGLQREHESLTGKKFTPKQEKTAKDISGKVTDAADKAEEAKNELTNELDREHGTPAQRTKAEQRALDAANKVVRDYAARRAQADAKARVAKTDAETKAAAAEQAKVDKVLEIATKKAREAAVRLAKAENEQRIADAAKKADDTQAKATKAALDAAMEVRKRAAVDAAKAENDARLAKSAQAKKVADIEVKRTKAALDAANKRARDAAANVAKSAREELGKSLSERAWQKAREYIDSGITDFNDLRHKLATDLGMPVDKVTKALTQTKKAKQLTDDLWKKQQNYRRLDQQAKRWLAEQNTPMIQKVIKAFPNLAFGLKVFGHGTVALGTHAPMVAFQPRFWKNYITDFGKMYKMVFNTPYHEMQVQDLLRRPNYTTARRAGLVNDPQQFEDYNSPEVTKWLGPLANAGNRGYSVLKILRQDMFDQYWNKLPKTAQIPEVAKAIADGVNHATGVVKMKAPPGSNIALFAPRLAASRAAWLAVDPLKAARTFTNWKNATEGEKFFAINQVKEKAWVVGTMIGLLAANEGMLEATDSKQRVNFNDPMRRDWLKFKVGGLNVGYGNAMLSMARLPARLYKIRESEGGKLKNLVYPDEDTYSVLGEYGRSQLSPFASLAANLWFKSDWQNRPLPNSNRKVPKRLAAQGVQPYTWPEFWAEQALPIPAEEAAREVWKNGLGMSEPQIQQAKKALATISVMAATGARVEDDTDVSP